MSCVQTDFPRGRQLPPIGRADLIWLLAEFGPECNCLPELLGYKLKPSAVPDAKAPQQNIVQPKSPLSAEIVELPETSETKPAHEQGQSSELDAQPTSDGRKLQFWSAVAAESFPVEDTTPAAELLTDADIHDLQPTRRLPLQPLQPWRRLSPFLRRRLGTSRPGSALDLPRLLLRLVALQPVDRLPRLPLIAWPSGICLLWDDQSEMHPFTADVRWLYQRWQREAGDGSILVHHEFSADWPQIPAGMPVLAVSAMGLQEGNSRNRNSWLAAGRRLQAAGHPLSALVPCTRLSADPELQRIWNAVVWDIGRPLPRHPRSGAIPSDSEPATMMQRTAAELQAADLLLNLLAPAPIIESSLLRQARLAVAADAPLTHTSVDLEWQVWHHSDCLQSQELFCPTDAASTRLQSRNLLDNQLRTRIDQLIQQQHSAYSCVRALEAGLRMVSSESEIADLQEQLQRVVNRLQELALDPQSHAGRSSGLPGWFQQLVQGLSPELRQREGLSMLIAQGLALADYWSRHRAPPPAGIDKRVHATTLQQATRRHLQKPVLFQAGAVLDGLCFARGEQPAAISRPVSAIPTDRNGNIEVFWQSGGNTYQLGNHSCNQSERLVIPAQADKVELKSAFGRVVLEPFERPTWADRMWMDQCGLAVEFQISAVPFVLRWIPPGEFLMGSPESEEGRDSNEGPQHRVTISRGFWMGETPVTQRQWRAVVQEATARQPTGFSEQLAPGVESGSQSEDNRPLNPAPSHFADRDDAPVEQVSWHDCVQFCEALSVLLPEGPRFHLPTEAEWEYACRAGTGSAFSDGSECTLPKGNDPALDRLGWFNENSENETHEVRQKPGNGWGLYDLHGNVWEWCRDANRSYGSEACSDPVGEIGVGAARVLRGGGWGSWARYCRSAVRSANAPGFAWHVSGLRLSAGQERAQSGTSAQASLESS